MRLVIVSVRCGDYLAVSLPAWQAFLRPSDTLTVATAPDDEETQSVARRHGAGCGVTDAWLSTDPTVHDGDAPTFNMAWGLDTVFGFRDGQVAPGTVCGMANPDLVPFGALPLDDAMAAQTLYGMGRYECLSPSALVAHQRGSTRVQDLPYVRSLGRARQKPRTGGYFMAFRWAPGIRFGSFPTAGKYDEVFARQFPHDHLWSTDQCYALHLGGRDKRNWSGRMLPRWPHQETVAC
jgi:hypothetical protein